MNWEALSAISTASTALVILATAIYAARQVVALNAQIEHLRRATLLDGTLAIFDEIFSAEYMTGYQFVMTEFEERMKDETFRAEALSVAPNVEVHKERLFLRHMERIGTLIKSDLLDGDTLFDFAGPVIEQSWEKLRPFAIEQRHALNDDQLWENFEFIATEARLTRMSPRKLTKKGT
jgi:hypothetical protein